ncbi:aminopeptidase RNPEPL1 [Microcaecilia unicolor]|uniref:Aminopeptidase RNPEPL1 n=1 Tax=Microcaecilia unicolor TaxID=1415580 RepID=A0A6P7Z7K3_9AMPH|nr:aminopeptidase RNPEPL1 [Microcaecilia unicolor]
MASAPPDLASASSFRHYRLHHFHLGLELRPEARELAGCLVLDLSALEPDPCALVLDSHPALSVESVRWRRGPPPPQASPTQEKSPCSPWSSPAPLDTPLCQSPGSPTVCHSPHPSFSPNDHHGRSGPLNSPTPGPCGSLDSLGPPVSAPSTPLNATSHLINSPSSDSAALSAPSPDSLSSSSITCTPVSAPFFTNHHSGASVSDTSCHFQSTPDPLAAPTGPDPVGSPLYSCPSCPLVFRVDAFTDYGSALILSVPDDLQPHQPFQVIIRYTATVGPAVWWLDPELTYGNSKLFVFTQGHSVCNRSFFPCFDTPAVKCTYSATVKAPAGIQVLMSATRSSYQEEEGVYQFYMEYPVPAYLVALVAGDIIPADIGPRSRVWAEPCLLSTATSKLDGLVERWLCAAENLYGPYVWGRYDLVFLPPSFPIVAMENPCLTFIISSILESDEFLIIDVIHEIAHSWFGNAVTNATWEEMWLSEGLATYAQRRITTETYGAAFTCLETAFRLDALHRQMKLLGHDTPVSKLQVKLELGVNPSNLMNLFTYEKGYCFVYYLSQLCGDLKRFDCFLRAYIEKYMFSSVVAQDLLDSFLNFFPELQEKCVESREGLEFDRWLNATGPPLAEPDLSQGSSFTNPVETLCRLWTADPLDASAAVASADITTWRTFQTVLFLDRLLDRSPLPHEVMAQLSKSYSSLLDSMNAEIRIRWLQLVVRNNYYPDLYKVRRFLENQMSRMYTVPLYEDLCASSLNPFAVEVFYQTQNQLHPNLRKTIQQILLQGVNSALSSTDPAMGALTTPAEPTQGAISLRDVNVLA